MKTKSAILYNKINEKPYSATKPLVIEEIELDPPQKEEVLVKIKVAGLCHSDLSVIDGNRPRPVPMVLGHEAAGEIVQLGEGVKDFEIGDHIVFSFLPSCGKCIYCQTGKAALCERGAKSNADGTLINGQKRFHKNGKYFFHHLGVSAFSEFTVASIHSLVKIDKDIPFEIAALFGCAVMTGVGAVVNTGSLKAGETVIVVGLGGVGFSAVLGAKAAGASEVIAADINPYKLEKAKEFGADFMIDTSDKAALEKIKRKTQGGVDLAVEFAGAMPALDFAFNVTKRGGRTVTGALPHPDSRLELNPLTLVGDEKTLKGCYLGSCVPLRDIPAYLKLYQNGRLDVDKLITDKLKLEDINLGFERLQNGESIRQIIIFD